MKHPVFGYILAIACVGLATVVRVLALPHLGDKVPFVTYFPAVFITALYARFLPTLFATVASGLLAAHFFMPPPESFLPNDMDGWTGFIIFNLVGLAIAALSERVHRQAAQVRQQRERFFVTLASIGDGVIVTDQNARITFINTVAAELTGWTLAAAQGQPLETVFRIVNEQTRRPADNPVFKALRDGLAVGLANHTVLIAKDGSERAIDDSVAPIREENGPIVGAVLVFRDVTHERASQVAKRRLAALVGSSEDAVIGQTFDGIVTDWNAGAERLFGYSAEEVLGRPIFASIVPPDRQEELLEALRQVQRGERVELIETVRRTKQGRLVPVSIRISPICDADGTAIGASAIDRDISQQRAAEQRRNARLAVTQILAREQGMHEAVAEILAAVCSALQWDVGCFWQLDVENEVLRCAEFWHEPTRDVREFRAASMQLLFRPANSLPGRVWQDRQPLWVSNVVVDPKFARAPQAKQVGLHGAFACPVTVGEQFLGVIEFFSQEIQQPDEDLLEMMATIGSQIGQYIERRETDLKLRRSEQDLSDFFENAAIGLHWVGPDGMILRANQAELKMLGYTHEEYIGHHVAEFHADRPVIESMLKCLGAGEELHDYEARLRCKDGSIKHVLIDSNVLWDEGRFIHTRCFTRDITDRKRLEQQLLRQLEDLANTESRVRSVVDNVIDGIITIDDRGIVTSFNRAAEQIFGYASSEMIGQNIRVLMPEPYHGEHDGYLANYLRTGEAKIIGIGREVTGKRRDGSTFPLDLAVSGFHLGNKQYFTGVVRDITKRRWMEQSLRFLAEASRSLATLVDYKSTLQKVAHLAVPAFADWCTVDMVDSEGTLERLAIAHAEPEKAQWIEELYQLDRPGAGPPSGVTKVLRTGEPELITEMDEATPQQSARDEQNAQRLQALAPKSLMCVPLKASGKIRGVLTFVSTESGRRYGTDDLAMAEDLAHRATIALENARLYHELRQADRRKDEFLAMLAHELRNPLAPIRSGLDLLAMDDSHHQETILLMQEQLEHVVRLVDDLLDVSRIMRGKVALRKESIDLAAVVKRSVETVRPLIDGEQQDLVVTLPEEPVWLKVDPVRLVQVLENLLNNASKYTDTGGRVELNVQRQSGWAIISVRDSGIGIEPELLPQVFELFTQSTRSLDRAQGGLGIGLTLVKNLVELHGGSVSAHSEGEGHGSTFVIQLPMVGAVAKHQALASHSTAVKDRRILVVDDNEGAAHMLALLLGKLGDHQVETAHDGPAALEAIQSSHPEIVLLDIGLPGMDGYDVGLAIRGMREFDDVLLVALTGYGQEEDRQRSKQIGFDEHLVKPPSLDQIKELLSHPKLT